MSELTEFPLTTAAQMTAADWTAKNPVLEQFQMGVESDTGKAKVCMGPRTAWNSLDYWNPGGVQNKTTTVQTNVGTKQALLAAVPTGKVRIVTMMMWRNASENLATMDPAPLIGWDATPTNWIDSDCFPSATIEDSGRGQITGPGLTGDAGIVRYGVAGEVFGIKFPDTSITATLDIDVHYYDVDA